MSAAQTQRLSLPVPRGRRAARAWPATAALLVLAGIHAAVPVSLRDAASARTDEACLTRADAPPAAPDLPTLERCAIVLPEDLELQADLGAMYETAGRAAEAETVYRRALALDAEYADLHLRLARLLRARGAWHDARTHAEAALALQPNRAAVLDLLADLTTHGTIR